MTTLRWAAAWSMIVLALCVVFGDAFLVVGST